MTGYLMPRLARASAVAVVAALLALHCAEAEDATPLRVCADPDNMPFSNASREGFENKLSALVAAELKRPLAYVWEQSSQSRDALASGRCDFIAGVPARFVGVETTRPYYWSGYVLISRVDRKLDMDSLSDHRLKQMKIGVVSIGGDPLFSPPARVLADHHKAKNLVGYPIDSGDGSLDRGGRIIDGIARGDIDVAAIWGPLAGYFVEHSPVPLTMSLIRDTEDFSSRKTHFDMLGLQYEIAMAVRSGDDALRQQLDDVLASKHDEITALLRSYDVPVIEPSRFRAASGADTRSAE